MALASIAVRPNWIDAAIWRVVNPVVPESLGGTEDHDPVRLFFFSYGQPKPLERRTRSNHLPSAPDVTFFEDVSQTVSDLMATPPGWHPGFLDVAHIGAGQRWREVLTGALDRSQILVVMLSPRYLESDWCRQERERFAARRVTATRPGVPDEQSMIIPVPWIPLRLDQQLPGDLEALQRFDAVLPDDDEMAERYRTLGVQRLLGGTRYRNVYVEVVHQLANTIRDLYSSYVVERASLDTDPQR